MNKLLKYNKLAIQLNVLLKKLNELLKKFNETHPFVQDLIVFTLFFIINYLFLNYEFRCDDFGCLIGNTFGFFLPYYAIKIIVYLIGFLVYKGKFNWPKHLSYYIIPVGLMIFMLCSKYIIQPEVDKIKADFIDQKLIDELKKKDKEVDKELNVLLKKSQQQIDESQENTKKEDKIISYYEKKSYYETGEIESVRSYANGKKEGKGTTYYETGKIKSEYNYINGKKEGKGTTYYKTGEIYSEINYVNGKKEGKTTIYSKSGKIDREMNYVNGIRVN